MKENNLAFYLKIYFKIISQDIKSKMKLMKRNIKVI